MRTAVRRLAIALALGCWLLSSARSGNAAGGTIHVETIPVDGGAQVLYARELGLFKKAGLDVQVDTLTNGAAIAAAVVSGTVDIGFSNVMSLVVEYKKNIPVRIVAPGGLFIASAPNSMCLVPRDSPIRTAKDLKGKTIAVNGLKNISQFGPQIWIDQSGGDAKAVSFVEMSFPEIVQALAQNRIDAGELSEPFVTIAKQSSRVLSNCMAAIGQRYLISAYFATGPWLQAHPDEARKFEDVMRETAQWANRNHDRSGEILAAESKGNAQLIHDMVRSQYAERYLPADVQPVIDLTARYGEIREPFPASDLFYRPLN